jgi:hypothetical protein
MKRKATCSLKWCGHWTVRLEMFDDFAVEVTDVYFKWRAQVAFTNDTERQLVNA